MIAAEAGLVVGGYLLGSLPWGYWIARRGGVDIRAVGSGNTGAANVWRTLGPRYGVPVLLLDLLKGLVPAVVGALLFGPGPAILAGAAAILGHSFPVFLGFGGGKGVATTTGVAIALAPLVVLVLVPIYLGTLWLFRYPSLASMTAAVAYPLLCLGFGESWPIDVFAAVGAVAIVARHHANIGRLLAGTESQSTTFGRGARSRRA